jgi:hypothetical protein
MIIQIGSENEISKKWERQSTIIKELLRTTSTTPAITTTAFRAKQIIETNIEKNLTLKSPENLNERKLTSPTTPLKTAQFIKMIIQIGSENETSKKWERQSTIIKELLRTHLLLLRRLSNKKIHGNELSRISTTRFNKNLTHTSSTTPAITTTTAFRA